MGTGLRNSTANADFYNAANSLIQQFRGDPERLRSELSALAQTYNLDSFGRVVRETSAGQLRERVRQQLTQFRVSRPEPRLGASLRQRPAPSLATRRPDRAPPLQGKRLTDALEDTWLATMATIEQARSGGRDVMASMERTVSVALRVPRHSSLADTIRCLEVHCRYLSELLQQPEIAARLEASEPLPRALTAEIAALDREMALRLQSLSERTDTLPRSAFENCLALSETLDRLPGIEMAQSRQALLRLSESFGDRVVPDPEVAAAARTRSVDDLRTPLERVDHALVVGAGPTGIATALELAHRGVAVDMVDARNPLHPTRPVQFSLKNSTVRALDRMGVLDILGDRVSYLERAVHRDDITGEITERHPEAAPRDHTRGTRAGMPLKGEETVATVGIADLQTAMLERFYQLGGRTISNARAGFEPVHDDAGELVGYDWYAERDGERIELGRPELIADVEGSRGALREALGVGMIGDENPSARMVAGAVEYDIGATMVTHTGTDGPIDGEPQVVNTAIMGNAATGRTWSIVSLPDEMAFPDEQSVEDYFRARTRDALRTLGADFDPQAFDSAGLYAGGRVAFPVQNRAAETPILASFPGQVVVAGGDARALGTPFAGLGAQTGVTTDAAQIGRFVDNLPTLGRDRSVELMGRAIGSNARAWHRAGDHAFIRSPAELVEASGATPRGEGAPLRLDLPASIPTDAALGELASRAGSLGQPLAFARDGIEIVAHPGSEAAQLRTAHARLTDASELGRYTGARTVERIVVGEAADGDGSTLAEALAQSHRDLSAVSADGVVFPLVPGAAATEIDAMLAGGSGASDGPIHATAALDRRGRTVFEAAVRVADASQRELRLGFRGDEVAIRPGENREVVAKRYWDTVEPAAATLRETVPARAIRELVTRADEEQVPQRARIDGIEVVATPGDRPSLLLERHRRVEGGGEGPVRVTTADLEVATRNRRRPPVPMGTSAGSSNGRGRLLDMNEAEIQTLARWTRLASMTSADRGGVFRPGVSSAVTLLNIHGSDERPMTRQVSPSGRELPMTTPRALEETGVSLSGDTMTMNEFTTVLDSGGVDYEMVRGELDASRVSALAIESVNDPAVTTVARLTRGDRSWFTPVLAHNQASGRFLVMGPPEPGMRLTWVTPEELATSVSEEGGVVHARGENPNNWTAPSRVDLEHGPRVSLDTPEGAELLGGVELPQMVGFATGVGAHQWQQTPTTCGPTSLAAALNDLVVSDGIIDQDAIIRVLDEELGESVLTDGTDLMPLAQAARRFGVTVDARQTLPGSDEGLARFREQLGALGPNSRMVVNFGRQALGQQGGGHFSPVAAYNREADMVLVFDTSPWASGPFWVSSQDLYNGMATASVGDAAAGIPDGDYRGYMVVSRPRLEEDLSGRP